MNDLLKTRMTDNKSLCVYPFNYTYVGPTDKERRLCCISGEIPGAREAGLVTFWNSDQMRQIRLDMLAGKPIKQCVECYKAEESNVASLRLQTTFHDQVTATACFENVKEDGSVTNFPSGFDYRTLQCNLQCLSCGPGLSSGHITLYKKMHGPGIIIRNSPEFEVVLTNEILTSVREKNCKVLYWAGGEPMKSALHWEVMDEVFSLASDPNYADYLKTIKIQYSTNLTILRWKDKSIPEFLGPLNVTLQASLDGVGETFEFLRDGASWEQVNTNWQEYFHHIKNIGVTTVLTAPVIFDIDRLIAFVEQYQVPAFNIKLNTGDMGKHSAWKSFLDIRCYPDHVFYPAIEHAIDKFNKCTTNGKQMSVDILTSLIHEREANKEVFTNISWILAKEQMLNRDKFLKTPRSFQDVLKIINSDAHDWYASI